MPSNRVVIDGLWRCLCPSIDTLATLRSSRGAILSARRVRAASRRLPTAGFLPIRSIVTATQAAEVPIEAPPAWNPSVQGERTENTAAAIDEPTPDNLTSTQLYNRLRDLKTSPRSYHEVVRIVRHLIKKRGEPPNLSMYDALIRVNADAKHGSAGVIRQLRADMEKAGVTPNSQLYHGMLEVLSVHPDYVLREEILEEMHSRWFQLTESGWQHYILGLLRDRQYELAMDKLDWMHKNGMQVSSYVYDIFIFQLLETDGLDEAVKLLQQRTASGEFEISAYVWLQVLDACSNNYHYTGTKFVWDLRVRLKYINPSDGLCTNVLNTAARYNDPALASDVLRVLVERGSRVEIHHYEGLLEAYAGVGDLENSLRVLCIMKQGTLEPGAGSTRPLVGLLMTSPDLPRKGVEILKGYRSDRLAVPVEAVNTLIEAAALHGRMSLALDIYKQFSGLTSAGPNLITFNRLLQGAASAAVHSSKKHIMFIATEMAEKGVDPDVMTYDYLIVGCLHEGLHDAAFLYFKEMRKLSMWPQTSTLKTMVEVYMQVGDARAKTVADIIERLES